MTGGAAIGQGRDCIAHPLLGHRVERLDSPFDGVGAVLLHQRDQAFRGDVGRRGEGEHIAGLALRESNVGEDQSHHVGDRPARAVHPNRGQPNAFAVAIRLRSGEVRGNRATDVEPVPAGGGPEQQLALMEDRAQQRDVVQMNAADFRVVAQEEVAWMHVTHVGFRDRAAHESDRTDLHR